MRVAAPLALLLLVGCADPEPRVAILLEGETMGGLYHVQVVPPAGWSELDVEHLHAPIEIVLDDVNDRLSLWRPNSELSQLRKGRIGPDDVTAHLRSLLERAAALAAEAGGTLSTSGDDGVDWFAVGYAVDEVAAFLDRRGVEQYSVEVLGEVRVRGRNAADAPWSVGVRIPDAVARIPLLDGAVATSGDLRAAPRKGLRAVVATASTAARAQVFSQSFHQLGEERAREIAEKTDDVEVLFIATEQIRSTPAFPLQR